MPAIGRRSPPFQHVVNEIYDAALEPSLWPQAMAQIAAYGHSSFAILSWRDRARSEGPLALRVETGISELIDEYFKGLVKTDPIVKAVNGPVDVPTLNEYWEPRSEFLSSERYERIHRPAGIDDRATILALRGPGEVYATVTLGRGPKEDRYDKRSIAPLRELSPHVRRALQISHRLRGESEHRETLITTLNQVEDGVFFLDSKRRVVFANTAGESLFARQVLTSRNRRLRALLNTETAILDRLLQRVIKTGEGCETDPGDTIALHGQDGAVRATVAAVPLRTCHINERFGPEPVRAAVFVREKWTPVHPEPETLRARFGLTRAEAEVASALGQGQRLQEIANHRGVSKETMRSQLTSIFDKTGVRRQPDLIKMLLTVVNDAPPSCRVQRIEDSTSGVNGKHMA